MYKERILLVEDEESIRELVALNLQMESYHVSTAEDGNTAVKVFSEEKFDLVILDIMLPGKDGFAVCESIRLENSEIPILFLSAKSNAEDRISGLKKGGDDYLTKPFNLEELLLRVKKLLERSKQKTENTTAIQLISFGENEINFEKHQATNFKNETISLTKMETKLLKLLIENHGQAVSRERILNSVWGYAVYPSTRTIDNFILAFRKYFEKDPKKPVHFISLRGIGYRFDM
jgi:two-component system alkaline phosphatase synthesis response regulator PhoP